MTGEVDELEQDTELSDEEIAEFIESEDEDDDDVDFIEHPDEASQYAVPLPKRVGRMLGKALSAVTAAKESDDPKKLKRVLDMVSKLLDGLAKKGAVGAEDHTGLMDRIEQTIRRTVGRSQVVPHETKIQLDSLSAFKRESEERDDQGYVAKFEKLSPAAKKKLLALVSNRTDTLEFESKTYSVRDLVVELFDEIAALPSFELFQTHGEAADEKSGEGEQKFLGLIDQYRKDHPDADYKTAMVEVVKAHPELGPQRPANAGGR